jgi:hypothetical protein
MAEAQKEQSVQSQPPPPPEKPDGAPFSSDGWSEETGQVSAA